MRFFHENYEKINLIEERKLLYFPPHTHYAAEIIFILEGTSVAMVNGVEHRLEQGDALVVSPNCIHGYSEDENLRIFFAMLDINNFPETKSFLKNKYVLNPVIKREELEPFISVEFVESILKDYADSSEMAKKGYMLLFLGKLLPLCKTENMLSQSDDLINQVFEYCRNNYKNKLTLSTVASALHISTSHLSHIFSVKMKINFCEYLNILRINDAVTFLRETDKSITEISQLCGFSTIRSFNRAFRKTMNTSPTEFRHQMANNR